MITIAGVIGAGKSTLASMLGQRLNIPVYYESVQNNPILPLYYSEPQKYTYLLQTYFLGTRLSSIIEAKKQQEAILDRSIYEDYLFMRLNFERGNALVEEWLSYELLFKGIESALDVSEDDLLVFIDVDFNTMMQRIVKRGRKYEQIEGDLEKYNYYKAVHDAYNDWYNAYNKSKKIKLPINLDFENNHNDLNMAYSYINSMLGNESLQVEVEPYIEQQPTIKEDVPDAELNIEVVEPYIENVPTIEPYIEGATVEPYIEDNSDGYMEEPTISEDVEDGGLTITEDDSEEDGLKITEEDDDLDITEEDAIIRESNVGLSLEDIL